MRGELFEINTNKLGERLARRRIASVGQTDCRTVDGAHNSSAILHIICTLQLEE